MEGEEPVTLGTHIDANVMPTGDRSRATGDQSSRAAADGDRGQGGSGLRPRQRRGGLLPGPGPRPGLRRGVRGGLPGEDRRGQKRGSASSA